ncbi:uncharacterized protein BX663DRAFT_551243 [Cokeromyces recurvatus]|uniref:uncharacterized protein n=1 Tax=Cokeromyces recurvatus TaxID=90255 RepID=UPI00221F4727|nr:uncharacterized protein BX663DRAFT_551243 [Cokeromyces recurvatus]KAI7903521.1 hypothetical protein BX663DRAFT_551243 [Cokeromyces recurvatus]
MVKTKKQVVELLYKNRKEEKQQQQQQNDILFKQTTPEFYDNPSSSKNSFLQSMFNYLTTEEIKEMLIDCEDKEEEAILRMMTQSNYLQSIQDKIKHRLFLSCCKNEKPSDDTIATVQQLSHTKIGANRLFKKEKTKRNPVLVVEQVQLFNNKITQKVDTNVNTTKVQLKKSKMGRLALDDALQQLRDTQQQDPFSGWSEARKRAYKMIERNPNSYYYRFNAPGEQQRKGKWTEEETKLFMQRLSEMGANSQWGLFSIAIPGRVGYQCSNYYRFMIESGQIEDPNYILDEKGKAHYLFDKKTKDGGIEKILRKHSKHESKKSIEISTVKAVSKQNEDDNDDDYTSNNNKRTIAKTSQVTRKVHPLILPRIAELK